MWKTYHRLKCRYIGEYYISDAEIDDYRFIVLYVILQLSLCIFLNFCGILSFWISERKILTPEIFGIFFSSLIHKHDLYVLYVLKHVGINLAARNYIYPGASCKKLNVFSQDIVIFNKTRICL